MMMMMMMMMIIRQASPSPSSSSWVTFTMASISSELKAFGTEAAERARDVLTAECTRVQVFQTLVHVSQTHTHTQTHIDTHELNSTNSESKVFVVNVDRKYTQSSLVVWCAERLANKQTRRWETPTSSSMREKQTDRERDRETDRETDVQYLHKCRQHQQRSLAHIYTQNHRQHWHSLHDHTRCLVDIHLCLHTERHTHSWHTVTHHWHWHWHWHCVCQLKAMITVLRAVNVRLSSEWCYVIIAIITHAITCQQSLHGCRSK